MNLPFSIKFSMIIYRSVFILLLLCLVATPGWSEVGLGDFQMYTTPVPAGDLRMMGTDGKLFRLSDFRGKVVLLNFWKKDCPYCIQEKTFLRKMFRLISRSDLKIVCANLWDNPAWVRYYGHNVGKEIVVAARPLDTEPAVKNPARGRFMGYFILNDSKEAVYEVKGFPSTYVIDKEGYVIASHLGMAQWSSPPVEKWLQGVLGSNRGTESDPAEPSRLERLFIIEPRSSLVPWFARLAPGERLLVERDFLGEMSFGNVGKKWR